MISVPAWVQNVNLKKKLLVNQNVKKDQKFCVNIIFKNHFANKISKVLGKPKHSIYV